MRKVYVFETLNYIFFVFNNGTFKYFIFIVISRIRCKKYNNNYYNDDKSKFRWPLNRISADKELLDKQLRNPLNKLKGS